MIDDYKELKESILNLLKENGFEINEDCDLVDSKTKKMVIGDDYEKK